MNTTGINMISLLICTIFSGTMSAFSISPPDTTIVFSGNASFVIDNIDFYDSGGLNGMYHPNENGVLTFYPKVATKKLQLDFDYLKISPSQHCTSDYLEVYDGPDTLSPRLGHFCGNNGNVTFISTHPTGALSVLFHSDDKTQKEGWKASVYCFEVPLFVKLGVHPINPMEDLYGIIESDVQGGIPPYFYN